MGKSNKDSSDLTLEEAWDVWAEDDDSAMNPFAECAICRAEGFSRQYGHSTNSCLADRIRIDDEEN